MERLMQTLHQQLPWAAGRQTHSILHSSTCCCWSFGSVSGQHMTAAGSVAHMWPLGTLNNYHCRGFCLGSAYNICPPSCL